LSQRENVMEVVVGIDVAKGSLEALAQAGKKLLARKEFKNDAKGRRECLSWSQEKAGTRTLTLCMESTGGYEFGMACLAAQHGVTVCVENPYRIKRFGEARGYQNKNDRADARTIAEYTIRMEPRPWKMTPPARRELTMLSRHRENLLAERTRWANRLEHAEAMAKLELCHTQAHLKAIDTYVTEVETQIEELITADEQLAGEVQALEGIHGIGRITARMVMLEMPDIEDFDDAQQWASQAGCYPMQRESGQSISPSRMCKAGNSRVRRGLYMPVTIAKLTNPAVRDFAAKLAAKGKKPKQIRVACMRKLLLHCYGVLKQVRAGLEPYYGERIVVRRKKRAVAS